MHGISIVLKFKAIKSFDLFKKIFTLPRGSIHPIHLKHHGAATSVRYGIIIKFSFFCQFGGSSTRRRIKLRK